jgi:uncharacterized membrane protein YedE/YeeE
MTDLMLGLFSGIAFGYVIPRAGATNPHKMARGHLMLDPAIPQLMLLAVAFSSVGIIGLQAAGVGRFSVLPISLVATGLGAVIFGIGWGLAGYCPGTCWAAVGEGRMDAIFAFLGGLAGAAVFAHFHEQLIPMLYLPTSLGKMTLTDLVGSSILAVVILVAVLLSGVWLIGRIWDAE